VIVLPVTVGLTEFPTVNPVTVAPVSESPAAFSVTCPAVPKPVKAQFAPEMLILPALATFSNAQSVPVTLTLPTLLRFEREILFAYRLMGVDPSFPPLIDPLDPLLYSSRSIWMLLPVAVKLPPLYTSMYDVYDE
jgi:hypothetical protein